MKRNRRELTKHVSMDDAIKLVVEHIANGGKIEIGVPPCPKCGATERYKSNPSPNWMNRFTCPKCGRHESR